MTGFAAPLALALGLLSIPLVLLYLLKPRREEVRVPSTFLWQQALEEVQANAPWQKLRRNLLLLLQLLILALLVLGLARPLLRSADVPGGDLVFILDASGSMAAGDVSVRSPRTKVRTRKDGQITELLDPNSRFSRAKERIRELAANKEAGRRVALISAGPHPRLLAGPTTDAGAVTKAMDQLKAPYGESNLYDAALLARSIAGRMTAPTVVLVGDGGPVRQAPPPLPYPIRFESVHGDGANAGILSLSARSGATGRELWASIGNYGPARTAQLSLRIEEKLVDAVRVQLPANGVTGVSLKDLPPGRVLNVELSPDEAPGPNDGDAVVEDNNAWFVDEETPPARVLLWGEESRFMERALSLVQGVTVERAAPGAAPQPGYDIYVLNGAMPAKLPSGGILLLAPPDSPLLPVRGEEEGLASTDQSADSPLLRYVDLSQASIARASKLVPPPWMEVIASSGDTPLLAAGDQPGGAPGGRKVVALAFAPEDSDLPLQVAFPILVDNLVRYLRPLGDAALQRTLGPGDLVAVPATSPAAQTVVRGPFGRVTKLGPADTTFGDTAAPGVYEVWTGKQLSGRFAVTAGSERESNIAATSDAPLRQSADAARAEPTRSSGRERWWPLLALALGVLLLEWWLYNRRVGRTTARSVDPAKGRSFGPLPRRPRRSAG